MERRRRVLVTGGNGFIGSWVVHTLLARGYAVTATYQPGTLADHLLALADDSSVLLLLPADLLDAGSISAAAAAGGGCRAGVVHVASPCTLAEPQDPQAELVEPAVRGTLHVLEAARGAGARRVVVTSSISAMVPNPGWASAHPGEPVDERSWTDIAFCKARELPQRAQRALWAWPGQGGGKARGGRPIAVGRHWCGEIAGTDACGGGVTVAVNFAGKDDGDGLGYLQNPTIFTRGSTWGFTQCDGVEESSPAFIAPKQAYKWYPVSKTLAEEAAWRFAEKHGHGMEVVTVHPSTCLGPLLQPSLNASSAVLQRLLQGSGDGQGDYWLGAVHVRDVAAAHVLLLEAPAASGRYLCTNGIYQFKDFARLVAKLCPAYSSSIHRFADEEDTQPWLVPCDGSHAARRLLDLGLVFRPLEEAIEDAEKSLRDKGFLP